MFTAIALFCLLATVKSFSGTCTGGRVVNGACWLTSNMDGSNSCVSTCNAASLVANTAQTRFYSGSGASDSTGCNAVGSAFAGFPITASEDVGACGTDGIGCASVGTLIRCTIPETEVNITPSGGGLRYCACVEPSSSGGQDPHFHGINGEHVDIVKDAFSNNKIFSIYCDSRSVVNARFSANPDGLLFMTEFFGRFGDVAFELNLGKYPQIYGDYFTEELAENRTKYVTSDGTFEADGSMMIAKFNQVKVVIVTASDVEGNVYFDIDLFPQGEVPAEGRKASGIVGRTFERAYTEEEFAEYHHFLVKSDPFNVCGGNPEYSH